MTAEQRRILWQVVLFVTTFITTTLAGAEWTYGRSILYHRDYNWNDFKGGLEFSIPLLLILTVHEFGHYFTALYHKVKTSLPYYIPVPPIPYLPFTLGTFGAVIRLRSKPQSNVENFDIGLAGPLAGFIMALIVLFYGFKTLPPPEYVFQFHPDYEQFGLDYEKYVYDDAYYNRENRGAIDVTIGSNLMFWIFEKTVADPARVPNAHELMHYPVLLAAFIALFITCLNLLPIGQLDGGHIVYGMFGFKRHKGIATIFFIALMFYAGLGLPYINPALPTSYLALGVPLYLLFLFLAFSGLQMDRKDTLMYVLVVFAAQFLLMKFIPGIKGYSGWLIFGFILGRVIGVQHPPSPIERPLDSGRMILGWVALLIFILCFSPSPLEIEVFEPTPIAPDIPGQEALL